MTYSSLISQAASGAYFGGKFALESADELVENPVTGEAIGDVSDEIAEAVRESEELSAQVDEVQKATRTVEIGNELVASAPQGDATMHEAALAQAGVAQTMNALGQSESDIRQAAQEAAMESYGKYSCAMESVMDVLKRVWQAIKDSVARIVQGVKNKFNRMWNSTASVLKRAKKLKDELKEKGDKWKDDEFTLKLSKGVMETLAVDGKFDPSDAMKAYASAKPNEHGKDIAESVKGISDAVLKATKELGEKADKDDFTDQDLQKVIDAAANMSTVLKSFKGANVAEYLGKHMKGGMIALPFGGKAVIAGISEDDSLSTSATLNSFTMRVEKISKGGVVGKEEKKVKGIAIAAAKKIPDDVESVVKSLEDFYNNGSKKMDDDIQKFRKDLDDAVNKVNESWNGKARNAMEGMSRSFVMPTQALRAAMSVCVYYIQVSNAMLTMGFEIAKNMKDKKDKD